jgi:hypothetical protein
MATTMAEREIFPKVVDGGGSKGILRVNLFS